MFAVSYYHSRVNLGVTESAIGYFWLVACVANNFVLVLYVFLSGFRSCFGRPSSCASHIMLRTLVGFLAVLAWECAETDNRVQRRVRASSMDSRS